MGYLEGFYYNPRIDKQLLREHTRGADRPVGVPRRRGRADARCGAAPRRPRTSPREFDDIFGKGNFFLELQPNGLEEQETVNGHLQELSKKTGIAARRDQRLPLPEPDRRARARDPDVRRSRRRRIHDEKRLHHRNDASS